MITCIEVLTHHLIRLHYCHMMGVLPVKGGVRYNPSVIIYYAGCICLMSTATQWMRIMGQSAVKCPSHATSHRQYTVLQNNISSLKDVSARLCCQDSLDVMHLRVCRAIWQNSECLYQHKAVWS